MESVTNLWRSNGSPRWIPAESAIQIAALAAIKSAEDHTSRFLAVCEWEKIAIKDLEISLVMARDLAESKNEPHQRGSVQDFLDQIVALENWWRASISDRVQGLVGNIPR